MNTLLKIIWQQKGLRFLAVGGTATLLQLSILAVAVELLSIGKVLASALSYCLSALYNYLANYYFTFASTQRHSETLPKFIAVAGIGVVVNTGVFWIALSLLGEFLLLHISSYIYAQLIAIGITLIVNYLLHKHWIYRRDS